MPLSSRALLVLLALLALLPRAPLGFPASMPLQQRKALLNEVLNSPNLLKRCDLERKKSSEMSLDVFEISVREREHPLVITGALDFAAAEATKAPLDRDSFVASFGHLVAGASNGRFDKGRQVQRYDVASLFSLPACDVKFFLADESLKLHREVLQSYRPVFPSWVVDFSERPLLSVGTAATTTWFHEHDETWFMLIAGKMAWWVADGNASAEELHSVDPAILLEAAELPAGLHFFVLEPGDVVYLPPGVPHATFNLDSFTFGMGAQGHTGAWPPLVRAAHRGGLDDLQWMLTSGDADFSAVNKYGQNALHCAVQRCDLAATKLLLELRADLDSRDASGCSAIHLASAFGNAPLVELLMRHGADPNDLESTKGQQPLHFAAMGGHLEVAQALMRYGSTRRPKDVDDEEPLHHAAEYGHAEMVAWIVEDLFVNLDAAINYQGMTPVHHAAKHGHGDILRYALKVDADLMREDTEGKTPLSYATEAGHASATDVFLSPEIMLKLVR